MQSQIPFFGEMVIHRRTTL